MGGKTLRLGIKSKGTLYILFIQHSVISIGNMKQMKQRAYFHEASFSRKKEVGSKHVSQEIGIILFILN